MFYTVVENFILFMYISLDLKESPSKFMQPNYTKTIRRGILLSSIFIAQKLNGNNDKTKIEHESNDTTIVLLLFKKSRKSAVDGSSIGVRVMIL